MADFLFWLYLSNSILLINHEIDSAYWKEWELFKLPGGLSGTYTVMDKLNERWKRRIDIYMGTDKKAANQWGKREVTIRW